MLTLAKGLDMIPGILFLVLGAERLIRYRKMPKGSDKGIAAARKVKNLGLLLMALGVIGIIRAL